MWTSMFSKYWLCHRKRYIWHKWDLPTWNIWCPSGLISVVPVSSSCLKQGKVCVSSKKEKKNHNTLKQKNQEFYNLNQDQRQPGISQLILCCAFVHICKENKAVNWIRVHLAWNEITSRLFKDKIELLPRTKYDFYI